MSTTVHALVQPTRAQLEQAAARLRRAGWPADLDALLADPTRAPLVRGLARSIARAELAAAASPPRPPFAARLTRPRAAPDVRDLFDPKRLAANDHDD